LRTAHGTSIKLPRPQGKSRELSQLGLYIWCSPFDATRPCHFFRFGTANAISSNQRVVEVDTNFESTRSIEMLSWALTFLVIALIAAALGFGGVAGTATSIAKILFVVFLVLFVVSLLAGGLRRPVV